MSKNIYVFTDGGARGNPGPAAVGVIIKDSFGKTLAKFGRTIGRTTNNVAEYTAVIEALKHLMQQSAISNQLSTINFFLDSSLVVNQLNGNFKVKDAKLRPLVIQVKSLEEQLNQKIIFRLIPREKNKDADQLVNSSLDGKS